MKIFRLFVIFSFFFSISFFGQNKSVSLDDSKLNWLGRVTKNKIFGWGGTGLNFKFSGSEFTFKVDCKLGPAFLNVLINDEVHFIKILNGSNIKTFHIKKPLPENVVSIIKSTEAHTGQLQFSDLKISGNLLPVKPKKNILFIGDSITCGYGNLSKSHKESFSIETEDLYHTYGFIAAQKIGLQFNAVSWSGKGMLRNYGQDDNPKRYKDTLPMIFDRVLPHNPKLKWNHSDINYDIICVNLGTNDNSGGNLDKTKFIEAYKSFITKLRKLYPDTPIVALVGPMFSSNQYKYMSSYIREALTGIKNTHLIQLPKGRGMEDLGAAWHPNKAHHHRMGNFLVEPLNEILKLN